MSLNATLDAYAADQALKHRAKPEQRKLAREQRKLIKLERAKILAQIDMHEQQRCTKCLKFSGIDKIQNYRCPCPANIEIRRLGKLLENLKNDIESGEYQLKQYDGITRNDLTVEIYQAMKKENKWSDALIAEKLDWHAPGLAGWKKAHGLVKSPIIKTVPAEIEAVEIDEPIAINVQNVTEQSEDVKSDNEQPDSKDECSVPLDWYNHMKQNYQQNIQETEYELQVKENEVNRLKIYEKDYRNLEIDLLNEQSESRRLRGVIEDMKSTYQMNQWLMEQHLVLNRRVEEIVGGN